MCAQNIKGDNYKIVRGDNFEYFLYVTWRVISWSDDTNTTILRNR